MKNKLINNLVCKKLRKILTKILHRIRGGFRFPESVTAHKYLDGLRGIEIGGSESNSFGLNTLNIDYTDEDNVFHQLDSKLSGKKALKVDIIANGDNLPFKDNVWDFVINSHVVEHFFDPIKVIEEWLRVIKPGGYLYMIVPHKIRTFDHNRQITFLQEIISRHNGELTMYDYGYNELDRYVLIKDNLIPTGFQRVLKDNHEHWNVWDTESFLELMTYMKLNVLEYQEIDDKVGTGLP